ncbi:hypothetical protein B566_EDAN014020 [Ephemera danica]|nr:hypothetical protein B566_EDAN014020 [Ephemera danica]
MFDSLRDTIQNVQEGITASFRGLTVTEPPSRRVKNAQTVNFNAGAELLHKYQTEWQELHQIAEENAKKAEGVDQMIGTLHRNLDKQWTDIGTMYSALSSVPQLVSSVQDLMEQISTLRTSFEEVEASLLTLEDLAETQALREEQLDHRFQLAMYKEKRLQEFEQARTQLAAQHKERVKKHEEQHTALLKERQATFGQAFSEEMDAYKKSGHLPKLEVRASSLDSEPSLEEVDLDTPADDTAALDEFLADVDLKSEDILPETAANST